MTNRPYYFLLIIPEHCNTCIDGLSLLRYSCNPVALFEAPVSKECPQDYQKIKVCFAYYPIMHRILLDDCRDVEDSYEQNILIDLSGICA